MHHQQVYVNTSVGMQYASIRDVIYTAFPNLGTDDNFSLVLLI